MSPRPPPAWRLEQYDTLASTSDLCAQRARAGEADGLAVLARAQTAGRGTRGRTWSMLEGNLALSVLLRPATHATGAGQWSLLAGVAAIEALTPHIDDPARLQLRWPNDILLDGAKLAGILVETEAAADGMLAWLVIGIGANLAQAPALHDRSAAALPAAVAPEIVMSAFLERLKVWRLRHAGEGFEPVRQAWLARAHPAGTLLAITTHAGRRTGRFAGLSAAGGLLLDDAAGLLLEDGAGMLAGEVELAADAGGATRHRAPGEPRSGHTAYRPAPVTSSGSTPGG